MANKTPVCERLYSVVTDLFHASTCLDNYVLSKSGLIEDGPTSKSGLIEDGPTSKSGLIGDGPTSKSGLIEDGPNLCNDIQEKIWMTYTNLISDAARSPDQIGADQIADYCAKFYLANLDSPLHSNRRISACSAFISLNHVIPGCARFMPVSRGLLYRLAMILDTLVKSPGEIPKPPRSYTQAKFLFEWLAVLVLNPFPITEDLTNNLMDIAINYILTGTADTAGPGRLVSSLISRIPDENDRCDVLLNTIRNLKANDAIGVIHHCIQDRVVVKKLSGSRILEYLSNLQEGNSRLPTLLPKTLSILSVMVPDLTPACLQLIQKSASHSGAAPGHMAEAYATLLRASPQSRSKFLQSLLVKSDRYLENTALLARIGCFIAADTLNGPTNQDLYTLLRAFFRGFQSFDPTGSETAVYDSICLCCWRMARNKTLENLDCRPLLEMFMKMAVFTTKRPLANAAIAVCQEIVGRGLVGDGGKAAGLIPNGTAQGHIPIMEHSEFGYQVILSGALSAHLASTNLNPRGHHPRLTQILIDAMKYRQITDPQIRRLLVKCAHWSTQISTHKVSGNHRGILHLLCSVSDSGIYGNDFMQLFIVLEGVMTPELEQCGIEVFTAIFKKAYSDRACSGTAATIQCANCPVLEVAAKFTLLFRPEVIQNLQETVHMALNTHKCAHAACIRTTWATMTSDPLSRNLILPTRPIKILRVGMPGREIYNSVTSAMITLEVNFEELRAKNILRSFVKFLRDSISGSTLVLPTVIVMDGICVIASRFAADEELLADGLRAAYCLAHHCDPVLSQSGSFCASYLWLLSQGQYVHPIPFWIPAVRSQSRFVYSAFEEGCEVPDWLWLPVKGTTCRNALDLHRWTHDPWLRLGDSDFSNTHFDISGTTGPKIFDKVPPRGFERETATCLILAANEYHNFDACAFLVRSIIVDTARDLAQWLYVDLRDLIIRGTPLGVKYLKNAAELLSLILVDGRLRFEDEELALWNALKSEENKNPMTLELAGLTGLLADMNQWEQPEAVLETHSTLVQELISFRHEIIS